MATFKKADFDRLLKENKDVNEFINGDGAIISGDRNVTSNSEIETGPIAPAANDDSGYEKGISTTTDRASRYRQPRGWVGVYGVGGSPYSHGERGTGIAEADVTEEVLKSKASTDGVVKKYSDTDINRNKIPDLEELANPAVINASKKLLDVIKHNNLTGEQVGIIFNFLSNNIDFAEIPADYKRIIAKNL